VSARQPPDRRLVLLGRALAVAAALSTLCFHSARAADDPPPPAKGEASTPGSSLLFYKLDPFVIPVISRESVVRHLTVVATLHLADADIRNKVRAQLPLLRHAMNASLYEMVSIQRQDGKLPPAAAIKQRLLQVSREVAGKDAVRDVLMESIFERRLQ
jgi:flagellar basal body-associated protein FliL